MLSLEAALLAHIGLGEVVDRVDLAGVADADGHPEVAQAGGLTARCVAAQRVDRQHGLPTTLDLEAGETVGVGAVAAVEMDQVHVGQLAGIVHRSPGAADRVQVGREHAVRDGSRERLAEVRRVEVGVLLVGVGRELTRRPVAVRLRVLGHPPEERRLVYTGEVEHHRGRHHLLGRCLVDRRARPRRHVGVPGRVDDPARQDRLAASLGLSDDADDRVAVHQRCDELAVQHRVDARLLDQLVGDQLETLGVELVGQRLALGHRCAHLLGALLELPADAAGVHRLLAAVPGEALDADRCNASPEAAEPLDQCHPHAGPRRRQGGGEATRTRPDDQHVGLVDDVDLAARFGHGSGVRRHEADPSVRGQGFRAPTSSIRFDPRYCR